MTILVENNFTNLLFEDEKSLACFWSSLIQTTSEQIESETRVSMLILITSLFSKVYQISLEALCLDKLITLIDTYMDRSDEALTVANFLSKNKIYIFSSESKIGIKSINFWDFLFQLLIEVEQESSQISSDIISSLAYSDNSKYEPVSMISIGLGLFVKTLNNNYEALEFLLDQYEYVSECDSNPNSNDEELEVVFDKGVDAINTSYLYFLIELIKQIETILVLDKEESLLNLFKVKFELIKGRLNSELDFSLKYLDINKMGFNDFKYSKVSSHLMFISNLGKYYESGFEDVKIKLEKSELNLNCFIQSNF
ncbi:unnamed protein product [Brachionus calyciflorus]|uniref:Uncharacterized protein n=1 Tax=Brachionus calyciflorus TaxID=104777 RepID=A0A814MDT6_9BILA|nr:unnamed protein product [Brachionus calyciflorus]